MLIILKARFRRILVTILSVVIISLVLVLIIVPAPDLTEENVLLRRIAELEEKVTNAETLNGQRNHELQNLFGQFSAITKKLLNVAPKSLDLNKVRDFLGLGYEGQALLNSANWTFDLSLPSIYDALPHLGKQNNPIQPAYKLSQGRKRVTMSLGIPTVKRPSQSYLQSTLKSIFDGMDEDDAEDCLVILMIAEPFDKEYVAGVAEAVAVAFKDQLASGLLEIISPPAHFYPNMSTIRKTFGDDMERVQWRSKQNLDYAFLMMYARHRSTYYVQLEDDILTKPRFLKTMHEVAQEYTALNKPWFVIDFCQLGFIGKLFKNSSLPILIQFFLTFYNDKPVDWLLMDVIQTMVCSPSNKWEQCREDSKDFKIQYKPSLFQHIGTHSSLKGKVQKLKDKQFGKVQLFKPHRNPPAAIETSIKHYKRYSISRAYRGETFYWGLVPQAGDFITFTLTPPVPLEEIKFVSGNIEHPSDKFAGANVELLFESANSQFPVTDDGFSIVSKFEADGVVDVKLMGQSSTDPVHAVRIGIRATSSENWVILSEIYLKPHQLSSSSS